MPWSSTTMRRREEEAEVQLAAASAAAAVASSRWRSVIEEEGELVQTAVAVAAGREGQERGCAAVAARTAVDTRRADDWPCSAVRQEGVSQRAHGCAASMMKGDVALLVIANR